MDRVASVESEWYLPCDISDGPFEDVRFIRFQGWLGLVNVMYLDLTRSLVKIFVDDIVEGTFYGRVPGKIMSGPSVIRGSSYRLIPVEHIEKDAEDE